MKKFTLLLLVADKHGVLARVSGLFSRRAYNIDSLSVGRSERPGISRMTVVVECDDEMIEQITEQIKKLVDVVAVEAAYEKYALKRELMLIKIKHGGGAKLGLNEAISVFRGKIVDMTPESVIVEITGEEDKLNAFLQYVEAFGIIETARTGVTALRRGPIPLGGD